MLGVLDFHFETRWFSAKATRERPPNTTPYYGFLFFGNRTKTGSFRQHPAVLPPTYRASTAREHRASGGAPAAGAVLPGGGQHGADDAALPGDRLQPVGLPRLRKNLVPPGAGASSWPGPEMTMGDELLPCGKGMFFFCVVFHPMVIPCKGPFDQPPYAFNWLSEGFCT